MGLRHPELDFSWYIPAWRGNRQRWERGEDKEPMRVELRPPNMKDAEALADAMASGTPSREAEIAYMRAHLRSIEGFEWHDGTAITSGADLIARRDRLDPDLWRELTLAALNLGKLEEGLVGKSASPSASARSHDPNAGIVGNVAATA